MLTILFLASFGSEDDHSHHNHNHNTDMGESMDGAWGGWSTEDLVAKQAAFTSVSFPAAYE